MWDLFNIGALLITLRRNILFYFLLRPVSFLSPWANDTLGEPKGNFRHLGHRGLVGLFVNKFIYGAKGRGIESRSFYFFYSNLTPQLVYRWKRNNKGGGGESRKKNRQAFQEWTCRRNKPSWRNVSISIKWLSKQLDRRDGEKIYKKLYS